MSTTMFLINKGTDIRGTFPKNFFDADNAGTEFRTVTQVENCFEKHEMIADPTGIATWCDGPGFANELQHEARLGFYVFERAGFRCIVHHRFVEYT